MKNKIKTSGIIAIATIMAFSLLGCEDDDDIPNPITRNITISGSGEFSTAADVHFFICGDNYASSGITPSTVASGAGSVNNDGNIVAQVRDVTSSGKNQWTGDGTYYIIFSIEEYSVTGLYRYYYGYTDGANYSSADDLVKHSVTGSLSFNQFTKIN